MCIIFVKKKFNMIKEIDVAKFFINLDANHRLFNHDVTEINGRTIYKGNLRLNKYLHMAQNLYIAKTGKPLIDAPLYAYENGAVMLEVQQNYSAILKSAKNYKPDFPKDVTSFLKAVYKTFENATIEELIELSHEDKEWQEKHKKNSSSVFQSQKMDSLAHVEEYKKQYESVLKIMERNLIHE